MPGSVQVEDFDAIQHEWEKILPSCSTNTIFVTPWWQRLWWQHFAHGQELLVLSIREDDEILGIAPLVLGEGVISFLGDTDLFDYHDFLVPRGKATAFYTLLWDHLMKLDWHTLDLRSLPQGSPTLRYLPDLAEKAGTTVEVVEEDKAPVASLPHTWDDYLAGLAKKHRHELRRKLRRLETAGSHRQYLCDDLDALPQCMDDFFRLHRVSRPDKRAFLTPHRERFFLNVALDLAPRGQFKLNFLEIDGVRVASSICFDYAGAYLLYNSGYDPSYSALSVGLLNKALFIKDAIKEGRHSFEFLRGDERYKYHLGGKDQAVYQLTARR